MLDRQVVKEFLEEKFEDVPLEIPKDIPMEVLVETFCKYTEDDLYEWLKDNYKSFFYSLPDGTDWDWVRERIEHYSKE